VVVSSLDQQATSVKWPFAQADGKRLQRLSLEVDVGEAEHVSTILYHRAAFYSPLVGRKAAVSRLLGQVDARNAVRLAAELNDTLLDELLEAVRWS
jgi:hypothetical protein